MGLIDRYHFTLGLCMPRPYTNHYAEKMLVGAKSTLYQAYCSG